MKLLFYLTLLTLTSCATLYKERKPTISEFASDGCSLFPDGSPITLKDWLQCCEQHDFSYWMGGTKEDRKLADSELKSCVKTKGHPITAGIMYLGVRVGGSPKFSSKFRWGYGWKYQREYTPLTPEELEQIVEQASKKYYSKYKSLIIRHQASSQINLP